MKTGLKILLCLVSLLVVGCNDGQMTTWMMTGPDWDNEENILTVRVGPKQASWEAGAELMLVGIHTDPWYGCYVITELDATPAGVPYVGVHALLPEDKGNGAVWGPIAGTRIEVAPNVDTVVEYQYLEPTGSADVSFPDNNQEHRVNAGLYIRY